MGEVIGTDGEFLDAAFREVARNERRDRRARDRQRALMPFGFWVVPAVGWFPFEDVPAQMLYRGRERRWRGRRARLITALLQKSWQARRPHRFLRQQPGKSARPITVPRFEDSVVALALSWALTRNLAHLLPDCCHGWRSGRGTGTAVKAWLQEAGEGRVWAAEVDVRQFFDRIPRRALWALLGRYVGPATRTVIQRMGEAASTTGEGLGQGYAHVPFVATLYLAGALRKSKVVSVLYGDNMLVVGRSREEVERGIARLVRHTQRLGLEVHYAEPRPCAQANFLSISLRPTSDGGLEPALSDDCIAKLRDLLPVARTKREADMRVYLESIRAACRPDS